ncbi:MAG: beta-ketoacyl synthase N-terminal-like domain-containing protein [Candidatus Hadarchaeales archaeon]
MREVAVVGIGHTKFGKWENRTGIELFCEAAQQAMEEAGVEGREVEALFVGSALGDFEEGQAMIQAQCRAELGLGLIPCTRFEGACASSTVAVRDAWMWVASGAYDLVLVGGTERVLPMGTPLATRTFAMAMHSTYEVPAGLTFPGVFALVARLYSRVYGLPLERLREQMAHVSIQNHRHGARNPLGQFYGKYENLKVEEVLNSRMVCDPITLLDCCPFTDGAAALLLCAGEKARKYTDTPVYVLGTGQGAGGPMALFEEELVKPPSRVSSARMAFKQARLEPKDIQVLELHDCFTTAEIVALEAMGFFPEGKAGEAVVEGQTEVGGKIPTNMSGGLLGKGHPIGATGASQVCMIVQQLRGEAPKGNQVDPVPEVGMVDTMGGAYGTLCHLILGRRG